MTDDARDSLTAEPIYLSELMTDLEPYDQYKIHFAKSDGNEPLDVYMRSFREWQSWNEWSSGINEFNRRYIFSLINFYPERDTWLFGGIWEVLDRDFENGGDYPYTIRLCEKYKKYIGRLKISYAHRDRKVRNRMENYFPPAHPQGDHRGAAYHPGIPRVQEPRRALHGTRERHGQ